jgi:rhodanese-related sulfurtransferase
MKKLGFNEAHTIIGGMEDWYRNRLPVEKIE